MARKKKVQDSEGLLKWLLSSHSKEHLEKAKLIIEKILEFRKVEKLYKTYVVGVNKAVAYNEENKVYFDFKLASTVTGRLSCSSYKAGAKKSKGVSFHTLPRESEFNIRSIFKAPPGYKMIVADQKTMELRVLAEVAVEPDMLIAFKNKEDIHRNTAKGIYAKDKISTEERQIGKKVAFTIVYGGSEFNIAETNKISLDRAKDILDRFKSKFPRVFEYMGAVSEYIQKNGFAKTIFNRRRNLPNIRSPIKSIQAEAIRQGVNFTIQSPASDLIVCSVIGIVREFIERNIDGWLVGTVHDSVIFIVREDMVDSVIEMIRYHMIANPVALSILGKNFEVPFGIDLSVGNNFGEDVKTSYY